MQIVRMHHIGLHPLEHFYNSFQHGPIFKSCAKRMSGPSPRQTKEAYTVPVFFPRYRAGGWHHDRDLVAAGSDPLRQALRYPAGAAGVLRGAFIGEVDDVHRT